MKSLKTIELSGKNESTLLVKIPAQNCREMWGAHSQVLLLHVGNAGHTQTFRIFHSSDTMGSELSVAGGAVSDLLFWSLCLIR